MAELKDLKFFRIEWHEQTNYGDEIADIKYFDDKDEAIKQAKEWVKEMIKDHKANTDDNLWVKVTDEKDNPITSYNIDDEGLVEE